MIDNNIPQGKLRGKMHAALDTDTKLKVRDMIRDPTVTYQELKDSLIGCGALTFSNASETLMNADRGKILALPLRQAIHKWHRLLGKMSSKANNITESCMYIAVAIARYNANPELKKYLDTKGDFSKDIFCRTADEWQANQPAGTKWSKISNHPASPYDRPGSRQAKKPGTCFHCGKPGHYSRESRTRLAEDKSSQSPCIPAIKPEPVTPTTPTHSTDRPLIVPRREITCFYCQKKGHKSPQCPLRQVKCVQVATQQPMVLKDNELMGLIGEHVLPVTCDSGADITIVPEECVQESEYTGDTCEVASFNRKISSGRTCNIVVTVGGRKFQRRAVAQPGKDLGWTMCLSLPYREKEDRNFIRALMDEKFDSPERAREYLPPKLEDGIVQISLMVGDTNANNAAAHTGDTEVAIEDTESGKIECPEVTMVESVPDIVVVKDEEDREEVVENELGIELDASQKVEADGVSSDGSADREGQQENLIIEGIHELGAEPLLARQTSTDPTLAHIRSLDKLEKEGYHVRKEVIYRTRFSRQGDPIEQICVPSTFR